MRVSHYTTKSRKPLESLLMNNNRVNFKIKTFASKGNYKTPTSYFKTTHFSKITTYVDIPCTINASTR